MKKNTVPGLVLIAIGSFIIYWSLDHSPNASIGKQFSDIFDENAYRMSEFWYYTCV